MAGNTWRGNDVRRTVPPIPAVRIIRHAADHAHHITSFRHQWQFQIQTVFFFLPEFSNGNSAILPSVCLQRSDGWRFMVMSVDKQSLFLFTGMCLYEHKGGTPMSYKILSYKRILFKKHVFIFFEHCEICQCKQFRVILPTHFL